MPLTPSDYEILATRELRKAGLELARIGVRDRRPLPDEGFALLLNAELRVGAETTRLLIECRREARPATAEAPRALHQRLADASADHGVLFSTAGFEPSAVRESCAHGIALLAVTDGRAAFARSGWSSGAAAPSWVPEFMAEVVDLAPGGIVRRQLIMAGQPRLLLDRLIQPKHPALDPPHPHTR